MMKWIRYILPFLIVSGVFIFLIYKLPAVRKNRVCNKEKVAKEVYLSGILLKKYFDKANHNRRTIILVNDQDTITHQAIFISERNNCFDQLQVGDFLKKELNSLIINIDGSNGQSQCKLDYGCK